MLPAERDACLLERYFVDRDEEAFEAIVDRHGPLVLSLCRRYLRDPCDVEDAFQATFLILARKGRGLRDRTSLSSWLYGVAHRVALRARADVLKRREREGGSDLASEPAAPATRPPDDSLEALDRELSRLPEKYRAPLVLCYLKGRTHDQAAGELGWPVGTVRSRMARARAILRKRLARRGLDATASLAIPRLELLSSSSVSLIPDSLIRATTAAASRYTGAAATSGAVASLSSASSSWPATALAQGVLATMLFSQLKLVGLGTAAVGLIAGALGAGALAVNASDGTDDPARPAVEAPAPEARRPVQPSSPDQASDAASGPSDVEARLQDMERKVDQLMPLLKRLGGPLRSPPDQASDAASRPSNVEAHLQEMERKVHQLMDLFQRRGGRLPQAEAVRPAGARPSAPPREPAPLTPPPLRAPAAAPEEPLAPLRAPNVEVMARVPEEGNAPGFVGSISPYGPRGAREIEARLINLYLNYKRMEESPHRVIYTSARERIEEQVRVLVAQLKEMKDEIDEAAFAAEDAQERHQALEVAYRKTQNEYDALMDARRKSPPRTLEPGEIDEASQSQTELGVLQRRVAEAESEARKLASERARVARRLGQVDKLIGWAESRFKGLAIDDPSLK